METIPGSGNWKLTIRREAAGITILRAATCDARARLPETLYGLPVTALGDHALSPTAASAEGEDLLVTCGAGTDPGTWSNRDLEDLTLPRSLEKVGDYALMNCGGLRTLRLHDGIGQWGGGVLMNCRRLAAFHLTRVGEQGDTLAWFADELPWELDVTVEETDGTVFRLLFPEYREVYEENCPAHHFDYNIFGAGYPYHHSFRRKRLDLRTYDELWSGFLGMEHDEDCAVRLAFWRLRYPVELTPRAEGQYRRGGSLAGGRAGHAGAGVSAEDGGAGPGGPVRRLRLGEGERGLRGPGPAAGTAAGCGPPGAGQDF